MISAENDAGEEIATELPGLDDPQRRILASTIDGVRVLNVYVPNGQEVGSDKYAYKLDWFARLTDYLRAELARHPRLAVVGDFNVRGGIKSVITAEYKKGS